MLRTTVVGVGLALETNASDMHVAIRAAASARTNLRRAILQPADSAAVRAAVAELRTFVLEHPQWPTVALPVIGLSVYATEPAPLVDASAVLAWLGRCDDSSLVAAAQRFEAVLREKADVLRANALGAIERQH